MPITHQFAGSVYAVSNERSVTLSRELTGEVLSDGDVYFPGELLIASLSSTLGVQWLLESNVDSFPSCDFSE